MLLLFTSGTHPRYIEDVLDILNLPQGAEKTIQIPHFTKEQPGYSYIETFALTENCVPGEEVIFFFINRDQIYDFKYIPLRKATYLSGVESAGMVYYTLKLQEICSAILVDEFEQFMKKEAQNKLYKHPESNIRDGYIAFKLPTGLTWPIDTSDAAWLFSVQQIACCKCFKDVFPIFTRFRLFFTDDAQEVKMREHKGKSFYQLRYGRYYTAKIDYYIPDAQVSTNTISATAGIVISPDCLESTSAVLKFGAASGMLWYKFRVKNVGHNIELRYADPNRTGVIEPVYIADTPISMRAVRTKWRWVLILGVLALMFIFDFLNQFPVEKTIDLLKDEPVEKLRLVQHWQLVLAYFLRATEAFYPAIISSIKSGLTLLMVLLYGKKEL